MEADEEVIPLRRSLRAAAGQFAGPKDLHEQVAERVARLDRRRRQRRAGALGGAVAVAAAVVLAAVVVLPDRVENRRQVVRSGPTARPGARLPGHPLDRPNTWRRMARSPLSPRWASTGAWTGKELLVVGGTVDLRCSDHQYCAVNGPFLSDGAAYDPAADRWRRLPQAPLQLLAATSVWDGTEMLVFVGRSVRDPRVKPDGRRNYVDLLAFDPVTNRWRHRNRPPLETIETGGAVRGGDSIYVWNERTAGHLLVRYDPRADRWTRMPPSPLGDTYDNSYVWDGHRLLQFAVPQPALFARPNLYKAAAFDPTTGRWRRLADSLVTSGSTTWVVAGSRVVNPDPGAAAKVEPGQLPGQPDPTGGTYDIAHDRWAALPPPPGTAPALPRRLKLPAPVSVDDWVVTVDGLFDADSNRWSTDARALPGLESRPAVAVSTGAQLLTWGGTVPSSEVVPPDVTGFKQRNTNAGWIYTPPAR